MIVHHLPGEPQVLRLWVTQSLAVVQLVGLYSKRVRLGAVWDAYSLPLIGSESVEGYLMGFYRKPQAETARINGGGVVHDPMLAQEAPALLEYLTLTEDGQGNARRTSTLLLFWEEGRFKSCLSERDEGLSLWGGGDTMWEAIVSLDALLRLERPPWRKAKNAAAPGKKR